MQCKCHGKNEHKGEKYIVYKESFIFLRTDEAVYYDEDRGYTTSEIPYSFIIKF